MADQPLSKLDGIGAFLRYLYKSIKYVFSGALPKAALQSDIDVTPTMLEEQELPRMEIKNDILVDAKWCPSPNFNHRPEGEKINLLVVHNISLPPKQFGGPYIEELFCNTLNCSVDPSFKSLEGLEVSAHLLIRRDGQILQFVPFNLRAWHAGVSSYHGVDNCNDFSIGIEMEGADDIDYEPVQYETLAKVTDALLTHYPDMSKDRIAGHCDIAPSRKTDPGQAFDWEKYKALITI